MALYHTGFGMGPGGRAGGGELRDRSREQAETLAHLQVEYGKPIVVSIRSATTPTSLRQSNEFQKLCYRNGIATYPSISRAAVSRANLLEWRRRQR